MQAKLVAPCGMNCELCIGYFGYTMSGKKRKHKCIGCREQTKDNAFLSRKNCAFLKEKCSLLKNNKIEFCFECDGFPCQHLKILDDRYREKYDTSLVDNLTCIKQHGMHSFLNKQDNKYRCPVCGELICLHNRICYNCKDNL